MEESPWGQGRSRGCQAKRKTGNRAHGWEVGQASIVKLEYIGICRVMLLDAYYKYNRSLCHILELEQAWEKTINSNRPVQSGLQREFQNSQTHAVKVCFPIFPSPKTTFEMWASSSVVDLPSSVSQDPWIIHTLGSTHAVGGDLATLLPLTKGILTHKVLVQEWHL